MDDALVKKKKKKSSLGKGEQVRLFMAHKAVLKLTKRQRLTREEEIVGCTLVSKISH